VLTLAGDEETMGKRGTAFLLDHVPQARGDAMICGDVGSPRVLRFGEKGFVWLDVEASGKAAHGAHVHKGINAIDRIIGAIQALQKLREREVVPPQIVAEAIRDARSVSEAVSGEGETSTLQVITVNCGVIHAGVSPNLIPARAEARFDIRVPAGVTANDIESEIAARLGPLEGIRYRVARSVDPTWTDPHHEIVRLLQRSGSEALGEEPVVNMRVGASDARLYRLRGLSAVVCGLTPYNLGGADEYIVLDDLYAVAYMHALTAFDFLAATR
jgi:acetylornithine deacetylase/succinyl-diaminopimelate desuccinylase-like protein